MFLLFEKGKRKKGQGYVRKYAYLCLALVGGRYGKEGI